METGVAMHPFRLKPPARWGSAERPRTCRISLQDVPGASKLPKCQLQAFNMGLGTSLLPVDPMPPAWGSHREEAPNRTCHLQLVWRLRDHRLLGRTVAAMRAGFLCVIALSQG